MPSDLEAKISAQKEWRDTKIDKLAVSITVNIEASGWRLPTELEWEYAAKGKEVPVTSLSEGTDSQQPDMTFPYMYAGSNQVEKVAWFADNSKNTTNPVCEKNENGFGLCDMSGNVYEWIWDKYDVNAYIHHGHDHSHKDNHGHNHGESTSKERVIRGGNWGSDAKFLRISAREKQTPSIRAGVIGFRLVRKYQTKVIPK